MDCVIFSICPAEQLNHTNVKNDKLCSFMKHKLDCVLRQWLFVLTVLLNKSYTHAKEAKNTEAA